MMMDGDGGGGGDDFLVTPLPLPSVVPQAGDERDYGAAALRAPHGAVHFAGTESEVSVVRLCERSDRCHPFVKPLNHLIRTDSHSFVLRMEKRKV